MNYKDLNDRKAVLKAIAEYDELGQKRFLDRYGYGKARNFLLLYKGNYYDSKAIVGAAYGHQYGTPLTHTEFSGGQATVAPLLAGLGFTIIALALDEKTSALSEEVPDSIWEGAKRTVTVNFFERNPKARTDCIEAHGSKCAICNFDFGEIYGEQFRGFIHIHHKVPLSSIGKSYKVNPKTDLIPVCPNCHAIIHYGNKTRSVDPVRKLINKANQSNR